MIKLTILKAKSNAKFSNAYGVRKFDWVLRAIALKLPVTHTIIVIL